MLRNVERQRFYATPINIVTLTVFLHSFPYLPNQKDTRLAKLRNWNSDTLPSLSNDSRVPYTFRSSL